MLTTATHVVQTTFGIFTVHKTIWVNKNYTFFVRYTDYYDYVTRVYCFIQHFKTREHAPRFWWIKNDHLGRVTTEERWPF